MKGLTLTSTTMSRLRQSYRWRMICWISTWLNFLVLILVVVKLFVLFLSDGSFFHQDVLKLTLMGLLGVSWSCYLWRYFSWEYEGVYWSFLCISWSSNCYGYWVLWSYTCYEKLKRLGILMSNLNVLLPLSVLCLLLELMYNDV